MMMNVGKINSDDFNQSITILRLLVLKWKSLPERPQPTMIEQIQNIDLFFKPNLSKIVGNVRRARMSVKAVRDKQKATSALVIPIDRQVSRGV